MGEGEAEQSGGAWCERCCDGDPKVSVQDGGSMSQGPANSCVARAPSSGAPVFLRPALLGPGLRQALHAVARGTCASF